jgi:hypothetical protein
MLYDMSNWQGQQINKQMPKIKEKTNIKRICAVRVLFVNMKCTAL